MKNRHLPALLWVATLAIAWMPWQTTGQTISPDCSSLQVSSFYLYPKNTQERYSFRLDSAFEHQTNLNTGDTTLWKIQWNADCTYTLKFVAGSTKMSEETKTFLKNHSFAYQVTGVSADYFTYKSFVDNPKSTPIGSDTMWMREKLHFVNDPLIVPVLNANVLKRTHFNDTSAYAVIFVYRPEKFTNSLGDYLIYLNGDVLCVAKNNSGYVFKVLKEGKITLGSRLFNDSSFVDLNVRFGKSYYVRSLTHWGVTNKLYNFKLEMARMDPQVGKSEFDQVDVYY